MAGAWRVRDWLGHPCGPLVAAVLPQPRRLTLIAVRGGPFRVVSTAEAHLDHGVVRGTRIRLIGEVTRALTELRRAARLAIGTPVVGLLDACPDPAAVPGRTAAPSVGVPEIAGGDRVAFERAARESGFAPAGVMAIPDAVDLAPTVSAVRRHRVRPWSDQADLLVTAAVATLRSELRTDQPEADVPDVSGDWMVEAVAGATW